MSVEGSGRVADTCRIDAKIRTACDSIADDAWLDIRYPQAVWTKTSSGGLRGADHRDGLTAFAGTRHAVIARLIVRRIRRHDPAQHPGQAELLPAYRHHAVFTDSLYTLVQAEAQHRSHAIIEQVTRI